MAIDIGPKIGIDGEAEFRKSLQNITQQLKTLGSEMKSVTSAFGDNADGTEALRAKSAVLEKQIDAQKKKVEELSKGLKASAEKYGENDTKALKWQQTVNEANAELYRLENQLGETNKAIKENEEAVKKHSKSSESWKKVLSGIGSVAVKAGKAVISSVGAATTAVIAFGKSSVDTGSQFDKSMSQVAATMGTTVDRIEELRDFAMDMGAKTAFSATEAADALNYMALAGYSSEQSMSALPTVLNLAAAGSIDLASASDMVTDAQSALGLSMEESAELVDKMTMASSKSNTSVSQLGSAILTIGGTAKNLAGGTTELATAIGILADNGIKGAEGGTALRNIILSLSAPTTAGAIALENLGVAAYDEMGNLKPLNETFGELNAALSQLTQQEQTNALDAIFNKVDLKSVNALLANSGERFDELSGYIDNAAGSAQKMADVQLDNLSGDITLFQSALEGAKILISDSLTPVLREFVQFGTDAIGTLSTAFAEGGLTGAMDALGTILSDGLDMVISKLPDMVDAGIQLLGALGQGLLDNLPTIISAAKTIISKLADTIIVSLPYIVAAAIQIITSLASGIGEALPELVPAALDAVVTIVDSLIDNIDLIIDGAFALIVGLAEGLMKALPELIKRLPELVMGIVNGIIDNVPKLYKAAFEIIAAICNGLWESFPQLIIAAVKIVVQLKDKFIEQVKSFVDIGKNIITGIWDGIKEWKDWLWDKITGFGNDIVDGFKDIFGIHSPSTGANLAKGIGEGFTAEMDKVSRTMTRAIPTPEVSFNNAAAGMVNGLQTAMTGISGNFQLEIPVNIDGKELYRYTLDDLRSVMRANPEAAT